MVHSKFCPTCSFVRVPYENNTRMTFQGSAIFTYFESDVVVQSSYFALNNVVSSDNYVVVVKAGEDNQSDLEGTFIDAGKNSVVSSGSCKGYFVQPLQACRQFGNRPSDNGDDEISVAAVGTDPAA